MQKFLTTLVLGCGLLLVSLAPTCAQTRTWVSGVGNDANPCSRTAPCKTFAGAISKTSAGGEISVLDPAGYGALTITKSISIVAASDEGSVLVSGTNGINISAGVNDVVSLHGIFFEGLGTGINGISITSAKEVHIRNCYIRDFLAASGAAIRIAPTVNTVNVFVSDCSMSNNARGVVVAPTGAVKANVFLDHVRIDKTTNTAVAVAGTNASAYLHNSTITGNSTGINASGGGVINSFGNNVIANNVSDGSPTATLPLR